MSNEETWYQLLSKSIMEENLSILSQIFELIEHSLIRDILYSDLGL
jgi:hypothetical protein